MYDKEIDELACIFFKKLSEEGLKKVYRESMCQYKNSVLIGNGAEYPIRTFYIRKEAARIAAEWKGVDLGD